MLVKKVLFIASEAEPYAKSGGLADVVASLPKALKKKGIDARVIIPLYSSINYEKYKLKRVMDSACAHMGDWQEEWYSVHHTNEPHGVDVYFIESMKYFHRDGYYHDNNGEFGDNLQRFAFLCKAAMQTAKDLGFKPDIIHVHDWQTSLVSYYLKEHYDPFFAKTSSVLTLHNMGYQGIFGKYGIDYAMINVKDFTSNKFESFGAVNLLKGGIHYAHKITTVSPTYAHEITGPIGGNGLDGYLRGRWNDLKGILNGVDTEYWNPQNDKMIAKNYNIKNYKEGKAANKAEIQKRFSLDINPNIPLFVVISRFAEQKGLYMLRDIIGNVLQDMICQFVVIGSGDPEMESFFGNIPKYHQGKVSSYIGYNEPLAHLLEAGGDFFIMPSLYEPCGLNQIYSQIYGTLPIVRSTGGLVDTVEQYNEFAGTGTGFRFDDINSFALYYTIGWAVSTYYDRPHHIKNMIKSAMSKDFSWSRSADQYIELYDDAMGRLKRI